MVMRLLSPQFLLLWAFIGSALTVHLRGKVRLGFWRQVSDHSTLMAPYNVLMYIFSGVPNRPILEVGMVPELNVLRDNWETIREEALHLFAQGQIKAADKYNDWGFNSFFRTGWKRFYLKWYEEALPSAVANCPKTVALVNSIPTVKGAMFANLPPGGKLVQHRDPYAGSLRYHLGLVVPKSAGECRIFVDGQPYSWRDGEDLLFDETYLHYAENTTSDERIILFCDVERPLRTRLMRGFNRLVSRHVMRAASTQNLETEPVGLLNRIYAMFGHSSDFLTRLKRRNRTAFRAAKYALFAVLAYFIFVH